LGVEEWPGYLPERLYTNAYGYALRPDVGEMWRKYAPYINADPNSTLSKQLGAEIRHEAFLQKLLTGRIKGGAQLPPKERKKIEEVVEYVEKTLERMRNYKDKKGQVFQDLSRLTQFVIDELELEGFKPPRTGPSAHAPGRSSWDDTFTENYARDRQVNKQKVEKDMEEYFDETEKEARKEEKKGKKGVEEKPEKKEPTKITVEDVEKARKGSEQVVKEYQQAKRVEVDQLTPMFAPVATAVSPSEYRDQKFITEMNAALKEWKTGRKEIVGRSGARLSIPHYIRHREEPFITRIRKSARGRKILVIADFGSMESQQEEYKKAIVSSMEVLNGIGSKTALYGFGGEKGSGGWFFFKVKRFEEPRWTPNHKTAALEAEYPCTPTDKVYRGLLPYIRKHRPDVTITITDGAPDNSEETERMVKQLKKHTRMVAFGIGTNEAEARRMGARLKRFGYHKVFAVDDVNKIPRRLVNLIAPTGRR